MQRRPFIVHACTSSQNSLTTGQFFQHIQAYFTSQPPPFRVIVGAYPKYQGHNIVHSKQMLAARSALAQAKFLALCAALKAAGRQRLANKLYAGWKVSISMCHVELSVSVVAVFLAYMLCCAVLCCAVLCCAVLCCKSASSCCCMLQCPFTFMLTSCLFVAVGWQ